MSTPILSLKEVSLRIPIEAPDSRFLKSAILRTLAGGFISRSSNGAEVLALNNINLDIFEGDKVGLIGHNGAGKSSFLRVVSGIYAPTSGTVISRKRVSPMLQKSFITSPDLSGIHAAKAYYLMTYQNLRGFEDFLHEIIEFSGLNEFIHLPIKGYSDGMRARLMFAMTTSGSHECLAMDEGFGTGDANFYKTAELRLQQFIEATGTLLLASHSESLLRRFCTRGLVFEKGKVVYDGVLEGALSFYEMSN